MGKIADEIGEWPQVNAPPDAWAREAQRIATEQDAKAALAWARTKTKDPTTLRQLSEIIYLAAPSPDFNL